MIKAVGLLSGGLDSILAIKLISEQGIDVTAITFTSPFFCYNKKDKIKKICDELNVKLKIIELKDDYLKVILHPKFSYGVGLNPCMDCKMHMLKLAKKYADEIGAKFIFTGEVIGQRPMSQHEHLLIKIEKELNLENQIVRPLSGKRLKKTDAEKLGYVSSENFLAIKGRMRDEQMKLAKKFGIINYPSPGGGCRLAERNYRKRFLELSKYKKKITLEDLELLKFGRHFSFPMATIIVGRNEEENNILEKFKSHIYFIPKDVNGPTTLLCHSDSLENIKLAAEITACYSDTNNKIEIIEYYINGKKHEIEVIVKDKSEFKKYNVV